MSDKEKDLNQDDENLNQENQDSDDSFGLPELEYEPLDEESEESAEEEEVEQEEYEEEFEVDEVPDDEVDERPAYMEDNDSKAPLVIGLIVTVIIVLGALGYFMGWFDGLLGSEEPKQEIVDTQPEPDPDPEPEPEPEPEPVVEDISEEPEVIPGEITTISERTGRYHIIVSSSIDGDLAMDMAEKLAEAGSSPSIINPYGGKMYHRLAIASFDSFQEAQSRADELKAEMGDGLWVLKY